MEEKSFNKIEKNPLDLKKAFEEKLGSIEPLSEREGWWESAGLHEFGIETIKRKAPCILFYDKKDINSGFNLWLEDAKECHPDYPHNDVEKKLRKFLEENKIQLNFMDFSSYFIEDNKEKRYLFFDAITAEWLKSNMKSSKPKINMEKLMLNYNIDKIFGKFPHSQEDDYSQSTDSNIVNIIGKDAFGSIRENSYLISFAQKYNMTNSQFMRFRLRAIASREAMLHDEKAKNAIEKGATYSIDLDTLAQETVSENEE